MQKFYDHYQRTGNRPLNKVPWRFIQKIIKKANSLLIEGKGANVRPNTNDSKRNLSKSKVSLEKKVGAQTLEMMLWWNPGQGGNPEKLLLKNVYDLIAAK